MINPEFLAALDGMAAKGVTKLTQLMRDKGKFIYIHDHKSGARAKKYNLVRHSGTVWSMLTVASELALPHVRHAMVWLFKNHFHIYGHEENFWFGKPQFCMGIEWHNHITLGANALALLAMAELQLRDPPEENPNPIVIRTINELMYGIASMYQPEADAFVHKWDITLVPIADLVSDYYVGEALFAVLHWQNVHRQINPIPDPLHEAIRSRMLQHMLKLAADNYGLEFQSHWMMYAVSYALLHWRLELSEAEQDVLLNYLVRLVTDVLDRTDYRKRNASTPIACRTEGMMAAMQIFLLPEINRDAKYDEFITRIMTHAEANILLQVGFVKPDGAIIRGGGAHGYNEVRIDYIQHSISSFKAFADIARRLQ